MSSAEKSLHPQTVREFWFGGPDPDDADVEERIDFWFDPGPEVDAEIDRRFGPAVRDALAGRLDDLRETPRDRLALVILLDQFPRNLHRGAPAAYAGDQNAANKMGPVTNESHSHLPPEQTRLQPPSAIMRLRPLRFAS